MQSFSTIRLKDGATDYVGASATRLQQVIRQLEDGLEQSNYTRLITPLIEEIGGREQIRMDLRLVSRVHSANAVANNINVSSTVAPSFNRKRSSRSGSKNGDKSQKSKQFNLRSDSSRN